MSILSFRALIALVATIILVELFLLWLVPHVKTRFESQMKRAEILQMDPHVMLREHESLRMIPPAIGVRYRREVSTNLPPASKQLYRQLVRLDDEAKLRLFQTEKIEINTFLGVLDYCYDGDPADKRLEEFLVQATAQRKLPYDDHAIFVRLSHNYFRTAQRSQYVGLVVDARRLYERFIYLVRQLNRYSGSRIYEQRALNRSNVRLKVLSLEHAFETEAVKKIQMGSVADMRSFLTYGDARLSGLARFNAASVLWHHHDQREEAVGLLAGNLHACGVLAVECKFLLAKLLNSLADSYQTAPGTFPTSAEAKARAEKARSLLDELTRELHDDDLLLDDIYLHRALVAKYRGDSAGALSEIGELRRRCPSTDLLADVATVESALGSR